VCPLATLNGSSGVCFQLGRLALVLHWSHAPSSMRPRFDIFCCFIARVSYGQALWNLESLRPLTQYASGLSTALSSNGNVYIAGGSSHLKDRYQSGSEDVASSNNAVMSRLPERMEAAVNFNSKKGRP
jgi:hypothetical protein